MGIALRTAPCGDDVWGSIVHQEGVLGATNLTVVSRPFHVLTPG
jgi:hypothetical protein